MSIEERKRRDEYRNKRKNMILIQLILIAIVSIFTLGCAFLNTQANKTAYINYTESSEVDYKVYLKDNPFYEEEYIGKGEAYNSAIIDRIVVDLTYELETEISNVKYDYSYKVDSQTFIFVSDDKEAVYKPIEPLLAEVKNTQDSQNNLKISEQVTINYDQYNNLVKTYKNIYSLNNTDCYVSIDFKVNVISTCKEFEQNENNEYVLSLIIPLDVATFEITTKSSVPSSGDKIVACETDTSIPHLFTLIVAGIIVDAVLLLILVVYIFSTKNDDIDYANKVRKVVSNYKSYIQQIKNELNNDGYQILYLDSIEELLEIRDTIQKPVLMYENRDKTMTRFMIPTDEKILYVYDIKVENYDQIYGEEVVDTDIDTPVQEEVVEEKSELVEEEISTITEDSTLETNEINEEDENESEETGLYDNRLNYSFKAKLILSKVETKEYYNTIVSFIKSYGVKVVRSWSRERVYLGRNDFASLVFKGKKLSVALALNPNDYEGSKYKYIDVSDTKRYQETPMMIKVTSDRKVKHIIELLKVIFEKNNIENKNLVVEKEKIVTRTKKYLITNGLIKVSNKEKIKM